MPIIFEYQLLIKYLVQRKDAQTLLVLVASLYPDASDSDIESFSRLLLRTREDSNV